MPTAEVRQPSASTYGRRHLRFGWWSLLIFLTLGLCLESLHGLKIGWYLNVSADTRRLLWTLAHAHGALLALLNLAFAATACSERPSDRNRPEPPSANWRRWASPCLMAASLLLPGGFFLGGTFIYDGDPGLGVLLVPVGAVLLFVAVFLTARNIA